MLLLIIYSMSKLCYLRYHCVHLMHKLKQGLDFHLHCISDYISRVYD